jgi:hypothetical protein
MQSAFRTLSGALAALLLGAVSACSVLGSPGNLPPGTTLAQARQSLGAGAEYALPDGGRRLEIGRGRETYMVDFDASGRLASTRQVLAPATFATITHGMSEEQVLSRIGRPAFVFPVGWQDLRVWNYRFGGLEGDCIVFQVSISNATHTVSDTGPNSDPACSSGGDRD